MAFTPGHKARVLIGDLSYSPKLHTVSAPLTINMNDITTFGDAGVKRFLPGQSESTVSIEGFIDTETMTDAAAWTTAQPLTYAPFGLAREARVRMVNALRGEFEPGSPVAGVSSFSIGATTDGPTDLGKSLVDHDAITADTQGGSVESDTGAATSSGFAAHLHVTAYSGLTSVVFTVADSVFGITDFATIGTFTTVTGVTSERITATGAVRRFVRYEADVTGTGSVTFQISFARYLP